MNNLLDTITAVSTPPGKGGVALIRVSGKDAVVITDKIFRTSQPCKWEKNALYHGWIVEGDEPVDEVVVLSYHAPHSYTGESVVEICCHGSRIVAEKIIELLLRNGAKMAEPGEFTQRAFLNGRMDLAQAEAVADLINAKTESSRRVAIYQLEGRLSERISDLRKALIESCGLLELELDFGEEDVEFASRDSLKEKLVNTEATIKNLLKSYQRGRVYREGFRVVIVGPPNAGKSSLLNCLVEKERAIVTDIPGTTRDTIEEMVDIDGVLFTLIDTAGIRESIDVIEKEGIRRSINAMENADLILCVLDGSRGDLKEGVEFYKQTDRGRARTIYLINKHDLLKGEDPQNKENRKNIPNRIWISAKTGYGIDGLIKTMKEAAFSDEMPHEGEIFITRARHASALQDALIHIEKAKESLASQMSQEFIALDLRATLDALGEITGKVTTDEILNKIFSDFCIGK